MSQDENDPVTGESTADAGSALMRFLRVIIIVVIILIGAVAGVMSLSLSDIARRFPLLLSIGIVVLGIATLIRELTIMRKGGGYSAAKFDYQMPDMTFEVLLRRGLLWLGFVLGYIGLMWVIGYVFATLVWLFAVLLIGVGSRWYWSLTASVIGTGMIFTIVELLNMPLPRGILYMGL